MTSPSTLLNGAYVANVTGVSPDTYILSIGGIKIDFQAGQHIRVGLPGHDLREYSIYSAPHDNTIDILIREVPGGSVSRDLRSLKKGTPLAIEGPLGSFVIPDSHSTNPMLFVANGTGIAPFRSMLRTYPDLNVTVLHGVRRLADINSDPIFNTKRYTACVSREPGGPWHGRVTDFLKATPPAPKTLCYLCGSCDMIYDVFPILQEHGIPRNDVMVETYY